ncbi:MAG: hypothetical protein SXG53_01190 [Pseudomonadota bacterium]|nr:hypothetical protein [Pseudomonadota bacterium]
MDLSKFPWLLNLLDPGHKKRAVLRFEPSGAIRFDVNRVVAAAKAKGELRRIGEMEQQLLKKTTEKTGTE